MQNKFQCEICHKEFKQADVVPLELVQHPLMQKIEQDNKNLDPSGYICLTDLGIYQLARTRELLVKEYGVLDEAEEEVLSDLKSNQLIAENINDEYEESIGLGERMADRISSFGGSWRFISIFFTVLVSWMLINTWLLMDTAYDPYPYILLNLVLSCLAAIQAPIIMMSQNRQAEKDRLTAENDYKVNLKSELLILQLTTKIDHLSRKQWMRTMEHKQMQIEAAQTMLEIHKKLDRMQETSKKKV